MDEPESEERRAPGYAELLERQCKVVANLLNQTRPKLAGRDYPSAVWSLAGRSVIAARSANLLGTVVDSWADMVTVGRTVFECTLYIKVLYKDPEEGAGLFWQHADARLYERNKLVLEEATAGRRILPVGMRSAIEEENKRLRPAFEAVCVRTKRGREYVPSRWYKGKTTLQLANGVGLEDHYPPVSA